MANGHLNLVRIYSYKNLVVTIVIFVLNAFACTHLVALYVVAIIFVFLISLPIGLIRPIKSKPHFIKGSSKNVVINLAKKLFLVFQFVDNCHNFCKIHKYLKIKLTTSILHP